MALSYELLVNKTKMFIKLNVFGPTWSCLFIV